MPKLESEWSNPAVSKASFAVGPEQYLASRALKIFRSLLLESHPGLEVIEVLEGELTPGMLLDLAAPSLFQEPRLVIVHAPSESILPELKELLALEVEDVFVWVRISGSPSLVAKLRKEFSDASQFIACDELKSDNAKIAFARAEFASAGKQVGQDALRLLVNAFANDLAELASACSQLLSQPEPIIDADLVERVFGGRVETTVFKIADAAFAGNAAEAVRLLRHALNTGADPVMMVGAFASRTRQLSRLVANPRLSAEALGVQPWMLDRVRKDMAGWSEPQLARLVRRMAETDGAVKGSSRDPEFVLENLMISIATRTG